MKKTRRWLALLLAVILVGSNALYQIGTSMSASETETTAESGQQDDSAAVPETQDQDTASLDQQKDTGGVQVQEVTPQTQQEKTNSQSEAAKTQQVQPAQNNTSVSDQNTQAVSGTEPAQETPEEKTYHVTIQKSDVDGGTIKAWGSDGNKADVTYNSENKYVKEVKEGEEFNFEITAKDTYKVAKVTDQNGTTIEPKAVNNNVYKYEVKNITAERTYSITYVKEEVKKAESTSNGDQHKSDDEQSEDADDDGEPAAKVQAAAEEVMTDFYVGADRTSVTVGDTVNVKAIIKPDNYSNKKVTWESSDDDTATVDENGVVTTLQTGIVTITGTSEANAEYTDSVVIQINPVSVTGITINGYNKDYLTKNESVQLTAVAEPQNAEDKELTWSSSNKNVATVDQTGNVTAKGQGTAVIRVENTASGKYATQEVTVYEKEPQSVTVHVWVTNQDEGKTYIFYLPEDGTVVNASSVHKSVEGYVTTGDIRVGNWISAGSSWTNIKKVTTAKRFRYNNGNIQYSTSDSGNNWKNVGAKSIVDFCESVRKGDSSSDTDVKVILGDWPYNDGVNPAHNRQTIRIEVVAKDDADNTTVVYNSGTMRYDNASNGEYGKIKFNCDESRYEVEKVLVYKNDAGTGNVYKTYKEIPTGGINVSFTTNATNHYLVRAIVKPKKFNVVYDANGGENAPNSETLTAVNGQKVTVATAPQPTRTDYIFAGWEYNGTTYYGGESFEMPPSNVTFVAKWIPASTAISYKSNNTDWGTVSRSHEIVKDGATAKGSVANAKEGYEFVEWQDANGKQVSTDNFYRPDEKAGSYTAIFQAKTYNVTYQFTGEVPDGAKLPEIGKHKFDSEVKVAEVADVPGYTFGGWTSQDVTLKDGTFTMPAKNVTLTGTWKQKAGKFGYYLSLKNASWKGGMPDNLEVSGTSGQGLPKYAEKVHYSYGDKYKVIANVPTAEGHAFIGWLDKERGDQSAAIRKAGDELTYIYKTGEGNKDQAYTLDALWASIAAKGGTYTYNGSSRQITADIAINEGLNLNAEYVEQAKKFIKTGKMEYSTDNKNWSEKNPGFTDAGTYTVYVRQNVTVGKTTTTLQSSAQIVINPRNVELTSATASKMYDGKALTKKEVTVSGDGFITGEGATYNVTGSQKVVGSSENTFTYTLTKATKEKNYNITTKNGTLTVTNRDAKYEITVKANSTTGTYNGTEYSAIGLESTTFTVDGNVYTVEGLKTEDPVKKDAGTYTNNITGTAVVKDADGNDVTNQFLVKTVNGSLVINKATVTLKSADLSKEYDGEALVNGNAALATETGWAEGEGADYAFTGSQTLVGSSSNTFSYALRANTNINNYTISKTEGTLTVTNRSAKYEITVKANSTNTTYNGKMHSAKGVESNEFTINGKKYTVSGLTTGDPEQKNAGTYPNNITGTAIVKDAKGNDVTEQFAVKVENGSLVINKAAVTLKSADLSKEYDGKALVNGKTALATETGWAEGEGADYTFTGSQTLVGNSSNTFSYALKANTNSDNYTINKTEGTLSVTNRKAKYTVTVTANSTTATYNGTEYSATGMQGTTFAIDGVQYTVEGLTTENPTQKDAGTYSNNVLGTAIVKDAEGNDVTEQFAVNTVNGSLVINKATVTLKSADLSKEYDGEALVNGTTALATETGWAAGEGADYAFTGSQTLVGSSSNTFSYALRANTNINNYTISKTEGTLTVTNRSAKYEITVKANSTNTTYNGKMHSAKGVESNEFTINGKKYTVSGLTTGDPEQKNAGTYPNNITGTAIVKDAKGNDVTEQFAVKVENGSLVINKAEVTLKSANLNKVYDGEALVNGNAALETENGWAESDKAGVVYEFTGSQTEVGSSENKFAVKWNDTVKESNYNVSIEFGTLTVTEQSIVPGPDPENPVPNYKGIKIDDPSDVPYDGNEHKWTPVVTDKDGNELTEGTDYEVSYNKKDYTNVTGAIKVTITGKGNYTGSVIKSYQITPASVSIKTNGAERVYNGKPLTAAGTIEGLVNNETVDFKVTGSQTEVGNSKNTYTLKWTGTAKESNYQIVSEEIGTLVVTENAEELVVTTTGGTFTYTGLAHGATVTVSELPEGYTLETAESSATATDVTDASGVAATADRLVIRNAAGEDVTAKLNIKKVDGTIVVTPAALTITTPDANKVYDGNALTAAGTISGFVNGETATFATTGSQTEVGNSKNAYTLTWDGTAKETNYTVSDSVGTLKVTEQSIIPGPDPENPVPNYKGIKIDDPSDVPYDGNEHKWTPVVTDKDGNELTEGTDYEVSYNKKDYTNVTGAIEVTITGKGNYTGSVTKSYQITPASVSIKTNGAERVYNGKPLTADGKIEGLVNNETVDFKVTGSQTEVGNSKNTYTLKWTGTAKKSNYQIVSKEIGTLVVTENAKEIVVTTTGGTFTYTGHAHGATVTVSKLPEGYTLETAESSATATDVTKLPVKATADKLVIRNAQGKDVTDKLKITKIDGTIKVTPAALTITTPRAEKVYDGNALTAEGSITGFVNGETATFITTGSQTEVGNSKNTYTLTWDGTAKETNYTVSDSVGTLKVTKQSIVPDPNNPESYKDVTIDNPSDATYDGKEHKWTPGVKDKDGNELKEGTDYEVSYSKDDFTNVTGEIKVTITGKGNYTGTVDKTYQITPKAVIITTDSDTRAFNDQPLTAPGRVDGIVAGETYEFTVTGTQTYVGSSANSYQMTWAKKGENKYTAKKSNYKVEENIGTLTVTDGTPENPVTPSLVVNKTHDTDKTYKAGDVITFTITVKNIYDEAKTITLEEQEGVTLDKTTFENVKPGKEITAAATYTVTEADIVNGTFTNNVKATFSGVDKEYTGTDTVDKFEESNPHMTITKTTKNADADHIYKLGETIQYVITVENDGNLTLTNVKIEDALTGNAGENAWTIDTFAPGETQTFEASYVVTEADVIAGKVVNNATGEAENPDPKKEETPVTPGEKEDPVETPNPGLTVIKTSDKTGEVKLGDKITYTITVTNNGNVTISGVKLEDSLTGDDWTLGNIKPGETVTKKTTYTVTEKDIIAGKVENHATATGKEPGGKDITGEGEKTVTTEESNPQITVTKETTSTPKNGKTYALGEKITYKITAKNTGNLTLTDVTVSDELTGNTGDKAFKIDGNFKPGEEATFEASYTVKESDLGKTVVNEATAAGKTTDPKNPEPGVTPGTTEDPVDQKNPAMTITKKVTDKKEEYQIGDTVKYEITVKNTGNTTQNNVLVEDRMNAAGSAVITKVEGAKGTIDGANVTLDTLAPGKEATITAEYTVVKEDRGNTITNAAVAKGEGETPVTPEVPVDVEDVYDIHVTHVFADGEESSAALPEDYDIENLKPGTTKLLNAEEVSGYTAYPAAERVTIEEEDVTVTFVYYKDAIGTDPANPDQPDNIPDRYQAVVKFEAVNGTVNIDHAVVTLFDENNEPAENGVGHLTLLQIANATADAGYDQSSLSWAPETPTIRYEITGEMTFTASFTATPATPVNPANPTPATPSTPANPAPSTPSAPANQTPARSTNIITRAAEAIADGAERIASDVREVLNNDDEDVPLAKQKLDDHKCCILHFLIMLLAAILYGFYTHNMKKRQKKMFEAREELDLELARRGLPTTKEQEQM